MAELWLIRKMDMLVPANEQSLEALRKVPADKWVLVNLRQPRNVGHHRKFMAVLQAIYPHQDMWPTFNSFRKAFIAALGFGEVVTAKALSLPALMLAAAVARLSKLKSTWPDNKASCAGLPPL